MRVFIVITLVLNACDLLSAIPKKSSLDYGEEREKKKITFEINRKFLF